MWAAAAALAAGGRAHTADKQEIALSGQDSLDAYLQGRLYVQTLTLRPIDGEAGLQQDTVRPNKYEHMCGMRQRSVSQ